jgi:heme/copper-type cytochrome/quinol oxidase subunit 1
MNVLSIRLVRNAFLALALGVLLAITFGFNRAWGAILRPVHAELNLFGWLTLLIYGMGYHMLPRFIGKPLERSRLATFQSWLAISGVWLTVLGWLPLWGAMGLRILGGILQCLAALLFVYLLYPLLIHTPERN